MIHIWVVFLTRREYKPLMAYTELTFRLGKCCVQWQETHRFEMENKEMNIKIRRTDSDNTDFQKLVCDLEIYLTGLDEEAHNECKEYNRLETINHVIIVYDNKEIVGCGAIREYDKDTIEIKRMFVPEKFRKKGVATRILLELENWAKEQGYIKSILETGTMMSDAITFYEKNNYIQIPNYGQYSSKPKSICFSKALSCF